LIDPTDPEPYCDVLAQTRALLDRRHPKRTMWLAAGTRLSPIAPSLVLPAGCFYGNASATRRLAADPSEETLAALLGYLEPKSSILLAAALVVQARDRSDCVVGEMVCAPLRILDAARALEGFGRIELMSAEAALARRAALLRRE